MSASRGVRAALLALPGILSAAVSAATAARIVATISLTVQADNLKHWGASAAFAAFVPDDDRSAYARAIRAASDARALCGALTAAARADPLVASSAVSGDGNINHRSGDEEKLDFVIDVASPTPVTHGALYVCSQPLVAILSRGAYPDERFHQASADHRLQWHRADLALRRGAVVAVHFLSSIDASDW
ncbi:MAG TPA: hypothetical protein VMU67_05375 [Steroidobacteraceae bacterium]|nr:hypothetical protein [Steroidobacteraceae bacterium]